MRHLFPSHCSSEPPAFVLTTVLRGNQDPSNTELSQHATVTQVFTKDISQTQISTSFLSSFSCWSWEPNPGLAHTKHMPQFWATSQALERMSSLDLVPAGEWNDSNHSPSLIPLIKSKEQSPTNRAVGSLSFALQIHQPSQVSLPSHSGGPPGMWRYLDSHTPPSQVCGEFHFSVRNLNGFVLIKLDLAIHTFKCSNLERTIQPF